MRQYTYVLCFSTCEFPHIKKAFSAKKKLCVHKQKNSWLVSLSLSLSLFWFILFLFFCPMIYIEKKLWRRLSWYSFLCAGGVGSGTAAESGALSFTKKNSTRV